MNIVRTLRIGALAIACAFTSFTGSAFAEETANVGNIDIKGKKTVFKHVIALRAKSSDENCVVVLATKRALSAELLKKVKEKDVEDSWDSELDQSYIKAVYKEDGTLRSMSGKASNNFFTVNNKSIEGKAAIAGERISGEAKLSMTGDFAKEALLTFDVAIDVPPAPPKLDPPVKPSVSGTFTGDGKKADIKFILVEEHEDFNDKPAITLIFTEKDPKSAKKPRFDAMFNKLGSSLILSVFYDGGIFGCQVGHTAHSKSGFTSLGQIEMVEFGVVGGNVTGHVSTNGILDTFDQKWEVDLKFSAPLPEKLRAAVLDPPKPKAKPVAKSDDDDEEEDEKPAKPTGPAPLVSTLPLPADAKNVDYKEVVNQIHCSSALPVKTVTKDLVARLKAQGWKEEGRDLVAANSILKREKDGAKLTIMVQKAASGSNVKIFVEGMDWTDAESGNTAPETGSLENEDKEGDAIEKAAEKMIQDALKGLPKGL